MSTEPAPNYVAALDAKIAEASPQPLTGDELAAIKARAEALTWMPRWIMADDLPDAPANLVEHIAGMDPETTLRLVAEVERLRALVEDGEA